MILEVQLEIQESTATADFLMHFMNTFLSNCRQSELFWKGNLKSKLPNTITHCK